MKFLYIVGYVAELLCTLEVLQVLLMNEGKRELQLILTLFILQMGSQKINHL